MEHLEEMSHQPISIQYDQTSNRLKDLFDQMQTKLSDVQKLNNTIADDRSFDQNRTELIEQLERASTQIQQSLDQREQMRKSAERFDENMGGIQQKMKLLRSKVEQYRLGTNSSDDLQVSGDFRFPPLISVFRSALLADIQRRFEPRRRTSELLSRPTERISTEFEQNRAN